MNYRKLPKNTVFDGEAATVLLGLRSLINGYDVVSGSDVETRDRIRAAIGAIGLMLLETTEAAYEPLPKKFRVTVVARKIDEDAVTVEATDEAEARCKARQMTLDAAPQGTLVDIVRVQEVTNEGV